MIDLASLTDEQTALLFTHPLVCLCLPADTDRACFVRYYRACQARSETLLSLRDTIDTYKRSSYSELAAAFPELWKEVLAPNPQECELLRSITSQGIPHYPREEAAGV
jgi:hypothetical protein